MPKRNNEQKIKHNEARRSFVKHGKKAMFCIEHIKAKHPDIVKEASDIYEYLVYLYPSKRNLMKTEVYLKQYTPVQNTVVQHTAVQNTAVQNTVVQHTAVQNTAVQNTVVQHTAVQNTAMQNTAVRDTTRRVVEPLIEIPLIKTPLRVEDIIPQVPIVNEDQTEKLLQETYDMISELQEDPDLKYFFNHEPANNIVLSSLGEESGPMTIDQEIDQIIREEFGQLGADLPDITCEDDDELSRLASM